MPAGNSLASVGGFCAGNRDIVDHQRLSGLGYCFSAALPPYLATAAIGAIDLLEAGGPALLQQLRGNAQLFRQQAATLPGLAVVGGKADATSPVVHLALDPPPAGKEEVRRSGQRSVPAARAPGGGPSCSGVG